VCDRSHERFSSPLLTSGPFWTVLRAYQIVLSIESPLSEFEAPVSSKISGGGGIRTHEGRSPAGFQDRCLQPLGHPSGRKTL
jgi:hypothetical protein